MENKITHKADPDNPFPVNKPKSITILEDGLHKRKLFTPDDEYDVTFCCGGRKTSCDKDLLKWFAQTLVSGSVLAFCFLQLAAGSGSSEYYTSTISLIIGTYLGQSTPTKEKSKPPI